MKIKIGELIWGLFISIVGIIYGIEIIFYKKYDLGMSLVFIIYAIVLNWRIYFKHLKKNE